MRKVRKLCLTLLLLCILVGTSALGGTAASAEITIGSQEFAEHVIIGHMIAELLEAHGYKTKRTLGLGGPDIVFSGMRRGDVDIWMSYSGTISSVVLNKPVEIGVDPDELYRTNQMALKELFDVEQLDPLGFNNTYVFAAPSDVAKKHSLEKVSDLIPIANTLTLGGSIAFMGDRPDGIQGVEQEAGMRFRRNRSLDTGLMFQALQLGQVDLVVAFSTHGQIAALDLVMLEDDRMFFPPYYAGLLVQARVLEEHPGLRDVLNILTGAIDEVAMATLNYEVDGHRKDPKDVAIRFLKDRGFIK